MTFSAEKSIGGSWTSQGAYDAADDAEYKAQHSGPGSYRVVDDTDSDVLQTFTVDEDQQVVLP